MPHAGRGCSTPQESVAPRADLTYSNSLPYPSSRPQSVVRSCEASVRCYFVYRCRLPLPLACPSALVFRDVAYVYVSGVPTYSRVDA